MILAVIKRDGARIGLADHDESGLGVLAWFHANVSAYSMAHALEHEGYSVETVEDIDCHDVETFIGEICARAGVTMDSAFVPFSQSGNVKPRKDGAVWRSLNWRVTIKRHGRDVLASDYAQGEGHAPSAKMSEAGPHQRRLKKQALALEIETGKAARFWSTSSDSPVAGKPIPAPSIGDVLQSLARDSDVLDSAGFEDWARDLGYDTDSREAESIYRACIEIATKLRAGLGAALLAEIRLAASYN